MKESKRAAADCRSVFKNGGIQTTKKDVTQAWISLINQLERSKKAAKLQKNDKTDEICYHIDGNGLSHL